MFKSKFAHKKPINLKTFVSLHDKVFYSQHDKTWLTVKVGEPDNLSRI